MGGESNPENQTRAEILRHAATLFAQRGYDAVSVREIVQAAGCTKPALYYHFGSKQGVALALFNEFKQAALQARGRAFAESKTPGDAFVYYAREMLSLAKPFRDTLAFGFSI